MKKRLSGLLILIGFPMLVSCVIGGNTQTSTCINVFVANLQESATLELRVAGLLEKTISVSATGSADDLASNTNGSCWSPKANSTVEVKLLGTGSVVLKTVSFSNPVPLAMINYSVQFTKSAGVIGAVCKIGGENCQNLVIQP